MKHRKTITKSAPIVLEVLDKITKRIDNFTPRHRILAEYILKNPEHIAFLSITDLARGAEVSQATVVRFCNELGYEGYAELTRKAQQAIQVELGSAGRFRLVHNMSKKSTRKTGKSVFERVLSHEIENLFELSNCIRMEDFYRCLDMIANADRIVVIGCMSAGILATFLGNWLSKIFQQVEVLTSHSVMASTVYQKLTKNSLVILISFPPYARQTVELGHHAAERGAQIVAITNSHISPIVPIATISFLVPTSIKSYMESYAAPITLINTIVAELCERNPETTQQLLHKYDEYTSKMDLYMMSRTQNNKKTKQMKSGKK